MCRFFNVRRKRCGAACQRHLRNVVSQRGETGGKVGRHTNNDIVALLNVLLRQIEVRRNDGHPIRGLGRLDIAILVLRTLLVGVLELSHDKARSWLVIVVGLVFLTSYETESLDDSRRCRE